MLNHFFDNVTSFFSHIPNTEEQLKSAIDKDNIEMLKILVKNKTEANQYLFNKTCPLLYWACCCESYNVALYLLQRSTDINLYDKKTQWRPLDYAIRNNLPSLTRMLILHGANPDLPLPSTPILKSKNIAKGDFRQIIFEGEQDYKSLKTLKECYEQVKAQADKAFAQPDLVLAQKLYNEAADIYFKISKIWDNNYLKEESMTLKNYYLQQYQFYFNGAEKLSHIIQIKIDNTEINAKQIQLRYRKLYKQKSISEELANQHTLFYSSTVQHPTLSELNQHDHKIENKIYAEIGNKRTEC